MVWLGQRGCQDREWLQETGRPPSLVEQQKPRALPSSEGGTITPEQEVITAHLAGRRITGNSGNNDDSREAGRMIVEKDNDVDNTASRI
jgi:hypothetical protein